MFVYFGIITCIAILGSNGQELCTTASKTQGECIKLMDCSSLMTLLRESASSPSTDTGSLRNSVCGFIGTIPKVCCPLITQVPTLPSTATSFPSPPDVINHPRIGLINDEICGPVSQTRLILGNKTMVSEFPWMAMIGYNVKRERTSFLCGGTLINKRYVLTAAHCVTGLQSGVELSGVRIGDHDISKEIDCDEGDVQPPVCADRYQNFFFEKIHVHSGYQPTKLDNDIALIRLDGDANFGASNVKPICLPVGNAAILKAKKVVVTGWGMTEKGHRSPDLLKVTLDIAPHNECAQVWRESNQVDVTYKQFCAGGNDGKDSCSGDSGGPLQNGRVIDGTARYYQYGIVSFGTTGCAIQGFPGVYTNVAYYMDWILDNMTD